MFRLFFATSDGIDNKAANISILLDDQNRLFSGENESDALEKFKEMFGVDFELGKVAHEDDFGKIIYANSPALTENDTWKYVPFVDLNEKNCAEFESIRTIVRQLGYEV